MVQHYEEEIAYYYDSHPTLEDLMGETAIHAELIDYLKSVLIWQFHGQRCAIYKNLNFYQTNNPKEYPIAPDLAVIRGVNYQRVSSWKSGVRTCRAIWYPMGSIYASLIAGGNAVSPKQRQRISWQRKRHDEQTQKPGEQRGWLRNCAHLGSTPTSCDALR